MPVFATTAMCRPGDSRLVAPADPYRSPAPKRASGEFAVPRRGRSRLAVGHQRKEETCLFSTSRYRRKRQTSES
jgi:hypothetical protein